MNLKMQQAAQKAVRDNLREHDKRLGYRGPLRVLAQSEEEAFFSEQVKGFEESPLSEGDVTEGVLTGNTAEALSIRIGNDKGSIVITSYSIHYTKLYELTCSRRCRIIHPLEF